MKYIFKKSKTNTATLYEEAEDSSASPFFS